MSDFSNFLDKLPVIAPFLRGVREGAQGNQPQNKQEAEIQQLESYGQSLRAALSGNKIQDASMKQKAQIALNEVSIFASGARMGEESPNDIDAEYKKISQFMQSMQSDTAQGSDQQQGSSGGGSSIDKIANGVSTIFEDVGKIGGTILKGIGSIFGF